MLLLDYYIRSLINNNYFITILLLNVKHVYFNQISCYYSIIVLLEHSKHPNYLKTLKPIIKYLRTIKLSQYQLAFFEQRINIVFFSIRL